MRTTTFIALLFAIARSSVASKFQCAVVHPVQYTDDVTIDKFRKLVTLFIGSGNNSSEKADSLVEKLKNDGVEFQAKQIGVVERKMFREITEPKKISEGDLDCKYYVQFAYKSMTTIETHAEVMRAFREEALELHNRNRTKHFEHYQLKLDEDLNQAAQICADKIASTNVANPSQKIGEESIGWWPIAEGVEKPFGAAAAERIQEWYDNEIKIYRSDLTLEKRELCRRFVAMIWKKTQKMGVGLAYGKVTHEEQLCDAIIIVIHYSGGGWLWSTRTLNSNVLPAIGQTPTPIV